MSGTMEGLAAYGANSAAADVHKANAGIMDQQSAANLRIAGSGIADMATEGNRAMSQERATQGASGMTSQGTGSTRESRVAMRLAEQMGVASSNAAQADINARHAADMERWNGRLKKKQGQTALWGGIVSDVIDIGLALAGQGLAGGGASGAAGAGGASGWSSIGLNKQTGGSIFGALSSKKS